MKGNDRCNSVWRDSTLWVFCTHKSCWVCQSPSPWPLDYILGLVLKVEKWGIVSPLPWTNSRLAYWLLLKQWIPQSQLFSAVMQTCCFCNPSGFTWGQEHPMESLLILMPLLVLWVIKTIVSDHNSPRSTKRYRLI